MSERPRETTRPLIDGGLTVSGRQPKPKTPVKEHDDE